MPKPKKRKPTNQFSVTVTVGFPDGPDGSDVMQWLNIQHAGKPLIPLDEECSKEHSKAGHMLHCCRRVRLTFQINKNAEWSLVDAKKV